MRQTLFHIPQQIAGLPIFAILLALWIVASIVSLIGPLRRDGFNAETKGQLLLTAFIGAVIAIVMPRLIGPEGLPIRGFGVMLLLGVSGGGWLALRRARQMNLDPEVIFSLGVWLFFSGIVGARLFYVVQKWDQFHKPGRNQGETLFAILNVTEGGLVVYGAVIAAGVALFAFCWKHKLPALALCDLIAPGLLLGLSLGRIGCFLNGCCYGGVCELPWAVTFPWQSPSHVRQVQEGLIDLHGLTIPGGREDPPIINQVLPESPPAAQGLKPGDRIVAINGEKIVTAHDAQLWLLTITQAGDKIEVVTANDRLPKRWVAVLPLSESRPVHPTQLYSTLDALLICLLLWVYYPFRRRDGEVTALMITIYPITRFLIEVIRSDEPPILLGMTISQNISLLLLMLAAVLWAYLLRRPAGTTFAESAPRLVLAGSG